MSLIPLSYDAVRKLAHCQLEPWMIYAPWRTPKHYEQRRIHQRVDNCSKDFRGWRVSIESSDAAQQALEKHRLRRQKSFYFGTMGGFEEATLAAREYRNTCEEALGLVAWRLKKPEHLEDALCFAGISLHVGKRAPYWIYRQNGRKIIGSIAQMGLRDSYEWLAHRIAELEDLSCPPSGIPLPMISIDQEYGLIAYGLNVLELTRERQHTQQWARQFLRKVSEKST